MECDHLQDDLSDVNIISYVTLDLRSRELQEQNERRLYLARIQTGTRLHFADKARTVIAFLSECDQNRSSEY